MKILNFTSLIILSLVFSGCAGYGVNNYKSDNQLPLTTKVAIVVGVDPHEIAIAEGLRLGASNIGAKNVFLINQDNVPNDIEYLVYLNQVYTGCRSAAAGATGAAIAGVTAAFAPITITGSPTSSTGVSIVTITKDKQNIGGGYISRQGSSLLVNCDKQLTAIGESWAEKQFMR